MSVVEVTAPELAGLFGVGPTTIKKLAASGLVVKSSRGRFDRDASTTRYIAHLREQAAGRLGNDDNLDPVAEGALLKRSQRELNELKKGELEGRLVSVLALEPAWAQAATAIKSAVLAIPGKCRTRLPHLTAHDGETIDGVCRDALQDARAAVMPNGTAETASDDDDGD